MRTSTLEELALSALEFLPEANTMVFDNELRYMIVRGPAVARNGFGSPGGEGRLVKDVVGAHRWTLCEPLYRAALRGETRVVETAALDGKHWYLL